MDLAESRHRRFSCALHEASEIRTKGRGKLLRSGLADGATVVFHPGEVGDGSVPRGIPFLAVFNVGQLSQLPDDARHC